MTQRDEGHDYRDSKNKAQAYERKKITIIWGTDKEDKKPTDLKPRNSLNIL